MAMLSGNSMELERVTYGTVCAWRAANGLNNDYISDVQ